MGMNSLPPALGGSPGGNVHIVKTCMTSITLRSASAVLAIIIGCLAVPASAQVPLDERDQCTKWAKAAAVEWKQDPIYASSSESCFKAAWDSLACSVVMERDWMAFVVYTTTVESMHIAPAGDTTRTAPWASPTQGPYPKGWRLESRLDTESLKQYACERDSYCIGRCKRGWKLLAEVRTELYSHYSFT